MFTDDRPATEAEAHAEWHAMTGLRYGCPQDACWAPDPEPVEVQCALDRDHEGHDFGRPADVYCPGRFTYPAALGPEEPTDPDDLPF